MGKVVAVIRKILFISAAVLCTYYTLSNMLDVTLNAKGTVYLVDQYVPVYYETLSDNVGLTTINGISNVYINMKADGYEVYKQEVTPSFIDVSFTKDNCPSYRFYFTYPEGRITFFSSEYENSYTGLSYIIDRKER